jgi:long-subunit acyl-CoA synthetase (AMP-forming)
MCTQYLALTLGWSVTCLPDAREIAAALPRVRPQFFFTPPRLWEKLRRVDLGESLREREPRR